jgi:hypothetical protein
VEARLFVDARTPYRQLTTLLRTLRDESVDAPCVVGLAEGRPVCIPTALRAECGRTAAEEALTRTQCDPPGEWIQAFVFERGVYLRTAEGNLSTGCAGVGGGIAVPKDGNAYDWEAVRACIERHRRGAPAAGASPFLVTKASPAIDTATLVSLLGALGGPTGKLTFDLLDRPLRRGRVSLRSLTMEPTLPYGQRVVAGLSAGFRSCFQRGLELDAEVTGEATLRVAVLPNGEVSTADVVTATGLPSVVTTCWAAKLRNAQFDPLGGRGARMELTLETEPAEPVSGP